MVSVTASTLEVPAWSLQQRMRRQLLALLCITWVAGSLAALAALWHEAALMLDSALAETAERLADLPEAALDSNTEVARNVAAYPSAEYVVYQVFDRDGRLRLRSHSAPTTALDAGRGEGVHEVGGWRVLTLSAADGGRRVMVAESLPHRRELIWSGLRWLAATWVAMLGLAAWALRALLLRGFAALESSRQQLQQRAADNDLRPVAPDARVPVELQPWIEAVNVLMQRVRVLLEAERSFAGHAAHELRTPLAAARAQAQRIAESPRADEGTRENGRALMRQLDRLTALSGRVLELLRVESGVALQRGPVRLDELAFWVADEFADARRRGALVVEPALEPAEVQGDVDAIGLALRNLIDNALKHGGGRVRVRAEGASLVVRDDGPGLDADEAVRLRQPFVRGRGGAREGAGLGLAIVERVAAQSGARLVLRSPPGRGEGTGRGLEARLEFDTVGDKDGQTVFGVPGTGSDSVHRTA